MTSDGSDALDDACLAKVLGCFAPLGILVIAAVIIMLLPVLLSLVLRV